jgi:hypothetical protein
VTDIAAMDPDVAREKVLAQKRAAAVKAAVELC